MAVLVTLDVPVGSDNYDALITQHNHCCDGSRGSAPHYAHPSPDGFTITEVWDSERDYAAGTTATSARTRPQGGADNHQAALRVTP